MKAIGHITFGGPEVLRVVEVPDPMVGPGEVRIRVRAAAVNPTDTLRRAGIRADGRLAEEIHCQQKPLVPGMEVAGILEAIGPGVTTILKIGAHVMGAVIPQGSHGAYAEHVVLPVDSVVLSPAGFDDVAASTLPANGLTASVALEELHVGSGQTIGVTGAAGILGGYVVQLAKAAGLHVIADAADRDRRLVEDLGADIVVKRGENLDSRFLRAAPKGLAGIVDAAVLNDGIGRSVRAGGRVITVRHFEGVSPNGVNYHPIRVSRHIRDRNRLNELRRLVEDGKLTLRVASTFPAADAADAHRELALGGVRGRLVLTFPI